MYSLGIAKTGVYRVVVQACFLNGDCRLAVSVRGPNRPSAGRLGLPAMDLLEPFDLSQASPVLPGGLRSLYCLKARPKIEATFASHGPARPDQQDIPMSPPAVRAESPG